MTGHWDLSPKPASASHVVLARQMEIPDTNVAGNVHGGTVMKMVDTAAGLAAAKHCGGLAVTAAMDEMSFLDPVVLGEVVTVKASVNEAFTTSMEVGVRVEAENVTTGRKVHTSSAYLVFVALDEGKPRPVPPVIAETDEERQRQREAGLRRQARLARKRAIEEARAMEGDA